MSSKHQEQIPSVQAKFIHEVEAVVNTILDFGNPFTEDSGDLLTLDTKNILASDVVKSVQMVPKVGDDQYQSFVKE